MFEVYSTKVNQKSNNIIKKEIISLDENLDCYILISCENEKFVDVALNNIFEYIIDKISINNTYKDFSVALENINAFIKTWQKDDKKIKDLHIIIGITHNNTFTFSNLGSASCYLMKDQNEIMELTDKKENKTDFNFISSGEILPGEIIILSSHRLYDFLSPIDMSDSINREKDLKAMSQNIVSILSEENIKNNLIFTSIHYKKLKDNTQQKNTRTSVQNLIGKYYKKYFSRIKLPDFLKKAYDILDKKMLSSSKNLKSAVFISGITISFILLYQIIGAVIGVSTDTNRKEGLKADLEKAKSYIQIASENLGNKNSFDLNIQNAETIIKEIAGEKIFLNDLEKVRSHINILKKQFDKITTFIGNQNNAIIEGDFIDAVKILRKNKKTYIIKNKGITGPIIPNTKPEENIFDSLEGNEVFVDATTIGNDIFLLTNFSKIVQFTKNGHFQYTDVNGQKTWQKSKEIKSYGENIYLISKEHSQIVKHSKKGNSFSAGNGYLKKGDLAEIGNILSIGIDGSFYILKNDLSIVKFYSSPKYRLEKLMINKLPGNYKKVGSNITLKSRQDLNYLYLLLNDKIWIFQPNSKDYRNTTTLTYIGQIESESEAIQDFFVNYDGEILILNERGVYKINYEVNEDTILIR